MYYRGITVMKCFFMLKFRFFQIFSRDRQVVWLTKYISFNKSLKMSLLAGNYSDTSSSEEEAFHQNKKPKHSSETTDVLKDEKYSRQPSTDKQSNQYKSTPLRECDNQKYSSSKEMCSTPTIRSSSKDYSFSHSRDSPTQYFSPKDISSTPSFKSSSRDSSFSHSRDSLNQFSTPQEICSTPSSRYSSKSDSYIHSSRNSHVGYSTPNNSYSTPPYKTPSSDNSAVYSRESSRRFTTSSEKYPTQSYKRPYEEDSVIYNKDSPRNSNLSNRHIAQARRSLPSKDILHSKNSDYSRSHSLSPATPKSSSYFSSRSCVTDQTPYSPTPSEHRQKRQRTVLPYYNPSDLITLKSEQGFIDSHCHIDFLFQRQGYTGSFSEYRQKHKDTFPECFKGCLAIFCNPATFRCKKLWESYLEEKNVWASFGCHPHNAKDYNDEVEDALRSALEHPKVRAMGEMGLDYSNRNNCQRDLQHVAFRRQLKIALEKKLPLVIHCREAHDDGMAIMKELVPKEYPIHLHCFTDKWERACAWLQEFPNLYIGITNVVTFPSAEDVHQVAKNLPLSRLLLETDSPYFIPRPLQREFPGTRYSHPGMAIHVAAQIAAIKDVKLETVLDWARQNTRRVYGI